MRINAIDFQPSWHVSGVVVQVRPEKIQEIKTALLAIPETEVAMVDPDNGKLVVVMQAESPRGLMFNMESARNIEGVLSVSLVYHEQEWD